MFDKPLRDEEYPDADPDDDFLDDDLAEEIDCPSCGAAIYEDAVRCPVCGEYVTSNSGGAWVGRSPLWILLGLAGTIAVIFALVR